MVSPIFDRVFWAAVQRERIQTFFAIALNWRTWIKSQWIPDFQLYGLRPEILFLSNLPRTWIESQWISDFQLHGLQPEILVLSLPILATFVWAFLRHHARTQREDVSQTHSALEALLAIASPTCSLWPRRYIDLARAAALRPARRFALPLSALMDDIYTGAIELRDPVEDLPRLLGRGTPVYAWTIALRVERTWFFAVLDWLAFAKVDNFRGFLMLTDLMLSFAIGVLRSAAVVPPQSTPIPDPLVLPLISICRGAHLDVVHALDTLPYAHLEQFIGALKARHSNSINTLESRTTPRTRTIFEFTALAPGVSFLSAAYIAAAVPFLPRRHTRSDLSHPSRGSRNTPDAGNPQGNASSQGTDLPQRTTTPLQISLPRVIELLKLHALTIQSITNVSRAYAALLVETHDALGGEQVRREDDSLGRCEDDSPAHHDAHGLMDHHAQDQDRDQGSAQAFITKWGPSAWREHRFLLAWEAALFASGSLERWVVVLGD
ncbi:hypothetical protein BV22DRAFT_1130626 [Leucogyrophana mollusca]|uniref:Uncharacterized protein n=1 Tax=Leucogyrophana mollusca TaxID=85980 RepID=A0ACB8BDQ7_9AGAM|nr:hypothetical protein BV22DRAFT_1130626 [Leucogyrophana mollusca]